MRNNNKLTCRQFVKIYHVWRVLIVLHVFVISWKFARDVVFIITISIFCHAICICLHQRCDNVDRCTIFRTFSKIDEKDCNTQNRSKASRKMFAQLRTPFVIWIDKGSIRSIRLSTLRVRAATLGPYKDRARIRKSRTSRSFHLCRHE